MKRRTENRRIMRYIICQVVVSPTEKNKADKVTFEKS